MVVLRVHIDIGLAVGGVAGSAVFLASPTRDFGLLLTLAALTCLSVAPLVALALAAWGDRSRVVVRHDPPRKARENPSDHASE